MEIRPILSSLRRHKTSAALIVLEIALSCAILCNAIFLVNGRLELMQVDSGVPDDELVYLSVSNVAAEDAPDVGRVEDLAALTAVHGVKSAAAVNQVPYGGNVWGADVRTEFGADSQGVMSAMYLDDGYLLDTLGLRLQEGRAFEPDEYMDMMALQVSGMNIPSVILTRTLADRLFPDGSALGQSMYVWSNQPTLVVGVVDDVLAPGESRALEESYHSLIVPVRMGQGSYLLRTDPDRREEVLAAAVDALNGIYPNRIIGEQKTLAQMQHDFHGRSRAVVWLLVAVCIALLAVTAFGIVGLASFWVQQRTRQIGVRRALGATRAQILRYFQVENFLLVTIGIALGMLLAYSVNQWLMEHYELARLPLYYLPIGGVVLWLLGQIAVFAPARKAAAVPPAIATRSA